MSYNPNIPSAGTKIRNTFNLIQENFKQINDLYGQNAGRDHVEFTNATAPNRGLHKQVTFVNVAAPPVPADPISLLHTVTDGFGQPQLRFLNSNNSANYSLVGSSGSTVLMGGIIVKWGFYSGVSPYVFPTAFPNNLFNVQLTSYATGTQFNLVNVLTAAQFEFSPAIPGGSGLYFVAIGN